MVGGERGITKETYMNQIKTQEKGGGRKEAKVKVNAYDEEFKQSIMVHGEDQTNKVNSKDVSWDLITISNSKGDTITKIKQPMVNSYMRAYHEKRKSGKHAIWSSKGLNVSMYMGYKEYSKSMFERGLTKRSLD